MEKYKIGKKRYSEYYKYNVIDIYERKSFLGIKYWAHHDTLKDAGQVEEVVYLLNNPEEFDRRLKEAVKNIKIS